MRRTTDCGTRGGRPSLTPLAFDLECFLGALADESALELGEGAVSF
jgi:hypothetical protein